MWKKIKKIGTLRDEESRTSQGLRRGGWKESEDWKGG